MGLVLLHTFRQGKHAHAITSSNETAHYTTQFAAILTSWNAFCSVRIAMQYHLQPGNSERRLHVALILSDPPNLLHPSESGLFLAEVVARCIVFRLTCLPLDS